MLDDAELLRRFATDHSQDAFTEVARRYLGLVYHAALRRTGGDRHIAQDVAQTVLIRMANNAEQLAKRPSIAGWLYTCTRYVASNVVREERRRREREREYTVMGSAPEEEMGDWTRVKPFVEELLWNLRQSDREILLLRFLQKFSYVQIGARMGISADAVRFRSDRALEKMRKTLSGKGVVSTVTALAVALSDQAGAAVPEAVEASILAGMRAQLAASSAVAPLSLSLMASTKFTLTALAAAGLFAVGSTAYLVSLNERADRQRLEFKVDLTARSAKLKELENQLRRKPLTAEPGSRGAALSLNQNQESTPQGRLKAALASNPALRKMWLEKFSLNLHFHFLPLYHRLGLSTAQVAQFESAWKRKEETIIDSSSDPLDEQMGMPGLAADPQLQAEIAGVISNERLQAYEQTASVRDAVDAYSALLSTSSIPLSSGQIDQIGEIFENNAVSATGGDESTEVKWDSVFEQAAKVLTPQQLAALRQLNSWIVANDQFDRDYGETRNAAAP